MIIMVVDLANRPRFLDTATVGLAISGTIGVAISGDVLREQM